MGCDLSLSSKAGIRRTRRSRGEGAHSLPRQLPLEPAINLPSHGDRSAAPKTGRSPTWMLVDGLTVHHAKVLQQRMTSGSWSSPRLSLVARSLTSQSRGATTTPQREVATIKGCVEVFTVKIKKPVGMLDCQIDWSLLVSSSRSLSWTGQADREERRRGSYAGRSAGVIPASEGNSSPSRLVTSRADGLVAHVHSVSRTE